MLFIKAFGVWLLILVCAALTGALRESCCCRRSISPSRS
jgi:hypothetical protein